MTLNDQQQAAIDAMLDFVKTGREDIFCLIGPAGTGKSFTIQHLIELLPKNLKVCFTAPTNKAVRVLKTMSERQGLAVKCVTIHSLLGLKIETRGGKEILTSSGKSSIDNFDLVVIDEISMIDEELLNYLHSAIDMDGVQLIMMGDDAQLPPIGEKKSLTFTFKNSHYLTKVMRQRSENPILGLCSDIREAIANGAMTLPTMQSQTNEAGNIGVHVMPGRHFTHWMPSAFSNEKFDGDFDKYRVVAWRNKTVDFYNRKIQKLRYADLDQPFAIGEPIVFSNPLHAISTEIDFTLNKKLEKDWDKILIGTESEGKIEKIKKLDPYTFSPTRKHINNGFHFNTIILTRYKVTCSIVGQKERISFIVTDNKQALDRLLEFMAKNVLAKHFDWIDYWKIKRIFTDIRPAYAMTVHKSQGSTFENVFVDAQDILSNPNREEALRCLYVAISRASNNVIVNI